MKLTECMRTHDGEYWIAETTRAIPAEDLTMRLGDLEVEPHLLGEDAIGRLMSPDTPEDAILGLMRSGVMVLLADQFPGCGDTAMGAVRP